ncbi:hypothetical protein NDU88_002577 [Pleurodeles waltl]|uniref:Uncharacterized protein n=1 Tax=Pleurodeles waltl TaxID=8319 RepID=A0AAV7T2H8_PLEWA|nr:hypothetical protein NDU88_002577 [Pleurodeles waltl]
MFQVPGGFRPAPDCHSPLHQPLRVFRALVRDQLERWGARGQSTAKGAQFDARQQYQQSSPVPRCGSPPAAGPVEDRAKCCPPRSGPRAPDL